MEILGIRLAPLNIPLKRRLQTLAVTGAFFNVVLLPPLSVIITTYLILYTHHWPEVLLYLWWIYKTDIDTCEEGGRPIKWVRSWLWWKYINDYFTTRLQRVPWVELDPNRNYLFCCFPHGFVPFGVFSAFGSNWGGFHDLFPNHTPHIFTLKFNFLIPMFRDLLLSLGMLSVSAKSIDYLLSSPGGGKVGVLTVGGAAEAINYKLGQNRVMLKNRKGFVRMALRHGVPLVPVFSFGEADVYGQINISDGSVIRRIQNWFKDISGLAIVIPIGRGFFQYSFGLLPFRKPISTVVGKPIEVEKVNNPTKEQIDQLHERFMKALADLFEEQKYNYVKNPKETTLIID